MFDVLFRWLSLVALMVSAFAGAEVRAQDYDAVAEIDALPGWRRSDNVHVAALRIRLAPGWKTYWRAPGDAGIPPTFNWSASSNAASVTPLWPSPHVFFQQGMRSIGYKHELVLPLLIVPKNRHEAIRLEGEIEIGVCKDICMPSTLPVSINLPITSAGHDPRIAAALADLPLSSTEAGVRKVVCRIRPLAEGGLGLEARINLPRLGGREFVAVESGNPNLWVAEPVSQRDGRWLVAKTQLVHVDGHSFALDRSKVRLTVIGKSVSVDIKGCQS